MVESITFDVLARDRASATFNKIGQSTEALESRFTRFTRAATGLATTLVGAQIGRSVLDAADQFELSRSRLETITQNIGQNFGALASQVDDADKRMAAFGFTSADTEGALASLESVTRNPEKALKDLALAADIARGRNIGLSEATLILQRVETGHVAQLAKLGIATKDAAGHTFSQAQALEQLSALYGGAASRYADTFAGKQAALAASMKNSAAEIGVALLPAALDLAHLIQSDVVPQLVNAAHWFDRNKSTIEPLAKAVLIGVAAWKAYVIWTKAATAANLLFGRSAVGAAAGATATAGAARISAGVAGGAAAGAGAASAGTAIGTGMAARLATSQVTLANSALLAARNIGLMGGTALGLVNFVKNPRSLGFPMGFNNDLGVGRDKTSGVVYFDSKGRRFSDPDLKKPIADTKSLKAATDALTASESTLATVAARTAAQIEAAAQKSLTLRSAQDSLRQALHDAAQTAADSGKALMGNSDAALANRDAIRSQVTAVLSVIDAMKARHASDEQQSRMLAILTGVIEENAVKLYGDKAAVDAFLSSLGLIPGQAANAINAVAALDAAMAERTGLPGRDIKGGPATALGDRRAAAAAKKSATAIAQSFETGFTPVVSKAADKASKAASTAFDNMKQRMTDDIQSLKDSIGSLTSSLSGFADLANNTGGTDTLGASGGPQSVLSFKRQQAGQLEQFARLYGRLRKAGLNAEDLHEFFAAGPAAIPAMQELLNAGRAGIRQENRLERRIQSASGQVARQEAGMENLRLIHRDLVQLPPKLARNFAREIKALRIVTDAKGLDRAAGKKIRARS